VAASASSAAIGPRNWPGMAWWMKRTRIAVIVAASILKRG
jgi:hypothetical protein